jgi:hypothetical protein
LAGCLCCSFLLDLIEKLGSFRAPIADECLDILIEAVYRVFHLTIPLLRALEASLKVEKFLVNSLVL